MVQEGPQMLPYRIRTEQKEPKTHPSPFENNLWLSSEPLQVGPVSSRPPKTVKMSTNKVICFNRKMFKQYMNNSHIVEDYPWISLETEKTSQWKRRGPGNDWEPFGNLFLNFRKRSVSSSDLPFSTWSLPSNTIQYDSIMSLIMRFILWINKKCY